VSGFLSSQSFRRCASVGCGIAAAMILCALITTTPGPFILSGLFMLGGYILGYRAGWLAQREEVRGARH
jgi:hypothetical protein